MQRKGALWRRESYERKKDNACYGSYNVSHNARKRERERERELWEKNAYERNH